MEVRQPPLQETLIRSLRELYDAEHRLTDLLPTVADMIDWDPARAALRREFVQSFRRLTRLETALASIGAEKKRESCPVNETLEDDLSTTASSETDPGKRLVEVLRRVRSLLDYSQSGYHTSRILADSLGSVAVSRILRESTRDAAPNTANVDALLAHAVEKHDA